jgi:hypothetical protein
MTYRLRRGKTTDAIFARAKTVTSYYTTVNRDTGERVDTIEPLSVEKARELFNTHKRTKMMKRGDGMFLFIIGSQYGDERIELEIGKEPAAVS